MSTFKTGESVTREDIANKLYEIENKGIYKRTLEEIKDEENEKEQLEIALDYMRATNLADIKWGVTKIRPRYVCASCGKRFSIPDAIQECVGEFWGTPAFEYQPVSPCCGDVFYDDEEYDTIEDTENGDSEV